MAILLIDKIPTAPMMIKLKEDLGDYIKLVTDLSKGKLYGGGKMHAEAEAILLREGSHQKDIWGGGIDLISKSLDLVALINIQPGNGNDSMEIIDPKRRKRFSVLVKRYFPNYD